MTTLNPVPDYVEYITDEPLAPPPSTKKKKLTKAERKERKEKALMEFRKLEITERLKRELELCRKSALRGREQWLDMCRGIKLAQMKTELEAWEAKTNRILTQKAEKVSLLLEDFKETEEMHKRSFGKQLEIMDYLTDIFRVFKDCSRLRYESQAEELLHEFYQETSEWNKTMEGYQLNFENVLHAKNLILQKTLKDDHDIFLDKRDDRVNTEILKRYRIRDSVAEKLENLHRQLLEFLNAMRNTSLDVHKYERVDALMERQRTFVVESQKLNDTEENDIRLYQDLQDEFALEEAEAKRKINDLKLEQAYFLNQRKSVEHEMKLEREKTHEKLKAMTTECYSLCKNYQKLQKYGELLLSLAANCRKLQTEAEKVVLPEPTYNFPDQDDDDFVVQVLDLKSHVDLSENEMKTKMELMGKFWRRQALAEAQNVELEKKKQKLTEENQHYRDMIKSLSKADNVEDLRKALRIQCVLDEEPQPHHYRNCKRNFIKQ